MIDWRWQCYCCVAVVVPLTMLGRPLVHDGGTVENRSASGQLTAFKHAYHRWFFHVLSSLAFDTTAAFSHGQEMGGALSYSVPSWRCAA